jgi:hypothetical protein
MRTFKKYVFYKKMIQVLFPINVVLIGLGAIAAYHFLKNNEVSALLLALLGVAVLFVGIILPIYFLRQLSSAINEMRLKMEQIAAQWIAGWLKEFENANDEPYRDPLFWMNIILLNVEIFGEFIDHPFSKTLADFAPILKTEIQRSQSGKKAKQRKTK